VGSITAMTLIAAKSESHEVEVNQFRVQITGTPFHRSAHRDGASTPEGVPAPAMGERSGAPSGFSPASIVISKTPVAVQVPQPDVSANRDAPHVLLRLDVLAFEILLGPPMFALAVGDHGLGEKLVAVVAQRVEINGADLDGPEAAGAGFVAQVSIARGRADRPPDGSCPC